MTLTVIYPEAFIHGGEEYHVDAGSPVALTCVIGELDDDEDDDVLDIFHGFDEEKEKGEPSKKKKKKYEI